MFSNCAPANLNEILDQIIASQTQQTTSCKGERRSSIVDLKILSSWLFQDDALTVVSKKNAHSFDAILKLVSSPHLSNILLEQMSNYPEPSVRAAIAEHDHLPGHVAFALSKDNSISVRYGIACNLTTPMTILEQLVEDENPYVVSRARITIASISGASKSQTNVVNLNFKENFKAQNISQKMKKLEVSTNFRMQNIAAY